MKKDNFMIIDEDSTNDRRDSPLQSEFDEPPMWSFTAWYFLKFHSTENWNVSNKFLMKNRSPTSQLPRVQNIAWESFVVLVIFKRESC